MGTWGLGTFEDDIACDWLEDLHDSDPVAFFTECLNLDNIGELEYLACIGVVCTAEIVCAQMAQPGQSLPESAREWLEQHRHLTLSKFLPRCVEGLRRVSETSSEMSQRWEDGQENFEAWKSGIHHLRERLESLLAGNA